MGNFAASLAEFTTRNASGLHRVPQAVLDEVPGDALPAKITYGFGHLDVVWQMGRIEARRSLMGQWTAIGYGTFDLVWDVDPAGEVALFVNQAIMGADPRTTIVNRMLTQLPASADTEARVALAAKLIMKAADDLRARSR